jgi:uncharacterized coiled-coil protein SlyX
MRALSLVWLAACAGGAGAPGSDEGLAARAGGVPSLDRRVAELEDALDDALETIEALGDRVAEQDAELAAARADALRAVDAVSRLEAGAGAVDARLASVEATSGVVVAYVTGLATGGAAGGATLAETLWTSDPLTGASVPRVDGVFAGLAERPELSGAAWDGVVDASLRRLHTPTQAEAQELFRLLDSAGRSVMDQGGQIEAVSVALLALDERTSAGDAALGEEARRLKASLETQDFRIGDALQQCGWVRDESSAGLAALGGALDEAQVALAALDERTSAVDAALGAEDRRLKAELQAQDFRIGDALAQCGWARDESLRLAGEDEALWGEVVRVEAAMGERVDEVKDWICRDPDLAGEKSLYCGSTSHL